MGIWVAAPAEQPPTALVATYHNAAATDWQLVALDTGRTTTGFADAAPRSASTPRRSMPSHGDVPYPLFADLARRMGMLGEV